MIAQTLHGYDQGHRLLARGGEVSDTELGLLDRLSDLSGYVPLGTQFDAYHTGFPCGRYYAFACTWPDITATRAGTVFTHTLLIPLDRLEHVHDLWALDPWHRRPASANERAPYVEPIAIELGTSSTPPPAPTTERALAAIVLWFGQPERPVLWMEDAPPDDVARYLWSLMWAEARQRFAFCTFALQVRHVRRKLFGFLALPPSARGSFHERAGSSAWWKDDALASTTLAKRTSQPWALRILERGADATWAMPSFCKEHELSMLEEHQLATFLRFQELDDAAHERLTAARARTDLLERLWPDLSATHPLSRRALEQLLRRQGEAPMSPRPFWDLDDLLSRRNIGSLVESDVAFADMLEELIAREVPRRLHEAGIEAAAGLTAILGRALPARLRRAILHAVRVAFERAGDDATVDEKAALLLVGGVDAREPALAETVLGALPRSRRVRVGLDARAKIRAEDVPQLGDHLVAAALHLADPTLAAELCLAEGRPLDAARTASGIVATIKHASPEMLRPILARLDAATRLAWALEVNEPMLATWAGERGSEAAQELALAVSELIERTATASNGARVLFARLTALSAPDLRVALVESASSFRVLPLALADGSPRAWSLIDIIVDTLSDSELLSAQVADILANTAPSSGVTRLADRIVPRLVRTLVNQGRLPGEPMLWLGSDRIREAMARLPAEVLWGGSGTQGWSSDYLPNLARACASRLREEPEITLSWVANLLERPLGAAYGSSFSQSLGDLATLLAAPSERDGWILLAACVLSTIRRTRCSAACALVERTFPMIYPKITRNQLGEAARLALSSRSDNWDVAKEWRHWLLDQWLDNNWPPVSFLRCLGDDEELFRRIAHRASWKWRGKDLLRSLPDALARDAELRKQWKNAVDRMLHDEDIVVDYD